MGMGAIGNLANSEKAVALGVLVLAATVLTGLGRMTIQQWMDYTQVLAIAYVAGKTVQGVSDAVATRRVRARPAPAAPGAVNVEVHTGAGGDP